MDGYYWPSDAIYADYSGYCPPVYGGMRPWHQTNEAQAHARMAVHSEGSPISQAFSGASSEDESDVQVSLVQHNLS